MLLKLKNENFTSTEAFEIYFLKLIVDLVFLKLN